jgi:alpha-D-glucose phosphate-specific phosphoglucomutase
VAEPIQFGTDGWRAVIADGVTFENVRRVAQAVALHWRAEAAGKGPPLRAAVGYDCRFLSEKFAAAIAEVLAANGVTTILAAEPCPSPAVSYAIKQHGLIGGLMVTASHNPPEFNGIKIKADFGGPADPEITRQVEALVDREPPRRVALEEAKGQGSVLVADLRVAHREAIGRFVDLDRIAAAKLTVAADSMHGVAERELERILAPRDVAVTTIRAERDPLFGGVNPEPVAKNLGALAAHLRAHRADIAVVTDGDADRIGAMTPDGRFITTHYCIAMLLLHMIRHRRQTGMVVKALNTTMMLDRICAKHGLPLREVPVGFKWVAKLMRTEDVLLGGEESGSVGFKGWIPERDGILACLLLLEFLACERKSVRAIMAEMDAEFGASRYARVDMGYALEKRRPLMDAARRSPAQDLAGSPLAEVKDFDGVKMTAKDGSWLMLRGSGTEPIIRIYAESDRQARADALVELGQQMAAKV